ncbi:MAG: Amuc_1102 family pilus-like protein [Chthoniobacterales bacterium]
MKFPALLAVAALASILAFGAHAEVRPVAEFAVIKISKSLIEPPQYNFSGAQPYDVDLRARWLQVEVEFAAAPEFTDELTVKYYVLIGGKLLTGEVTHVRLFAGRELRSVMYLPPDAFARALGNRLPSANTVDNVAVQLVHGSALASELSLERAAPQWFATLPPVRGFLLNKNETPFAPLYWDRYAQIKSPR